MNRILIKQIKIITDELLKNSLVNLYNVGSYNNATKELSWSSSEPLDISFVLKNSDYAEIYKICCEKEAYNFMFIDGSLIQLMYRLDRRSQKIIAHRLAYLPNPNVEIYSNNENFDEDYYHSLDMFSEFIDKSSFPVPVRFDYDIDENYYVEGTHTYSHLTLGNYKNCRIPVNIPLTPYKFIDFILKNFYNDKYINFHDKCTNTFENLLSEKEKKNIYFKF